MVRTTQRGFTLIELVVVIVILGILAAFAVPRFMGLEGQARAASVEALEGSLRSASTLAHSVWLANGGDDATIQIDGQTVNMTANGYPTAADIGLTIQDLSGFTPSDSGTTATFARNGATTAAQCQVTYTTNAAAAPTITGPSTGC